MVLSMLCKSRFLVSCWWQSPGADELLRQSKQHVFRLVRRLYRRISIAKLSLCVVYVRCARLVDLCFQTMGSWRTRPAPRCYSGSSISKHSCIARLLQYYITLINKIMRYYKLIYSYEYEIILYKITVCFKELKTK